MGRDALLVKTNFETVQCLRYIGAMHEQRPARTGAGSTRTARLADVARAAGVSQGTVSNVFNRPGIVSGEVRERVLAAAVALGYAGPDPRGRILRAGKVNAIGVVSSQPLA